MENQRDSKYDSVIEKTLLKFNNDKDFREQVKESMNFASELMENFNKQIKKFVIPQGFFTKISKELCNLKINKRGEICLILREFIILLKDNGVYKGSIYDFEEVENINDELSMKIDDIFERISTKIDEAFDEQDRLIEEFIKYAEPGKKCSKGGKNSTKTRNKEKIEAWNVWHLEDLSKWSNENVRERFCQIKIQIKGKEYGMNKSVKTFNKWINDFKSGWTPENIC